MCKILVVNILYRKKYINEITTLNNKITMARELLLCRAIDADDYKVIKSEAEMKINILEAKISELGSNTIKIQDLALLLD